jgi:hypothetical protein
MPREVFIMRIRVNGKTYESTEKTVEQSKILGAAVIGATVLFGFMSAVYFAVNALVAFGIV